MSTYKLAQWVEFNQGDEAQTLLEGQVTRVWANDKYVTIKTDGHTYVRLISEVRPSSTLAAWRASHGIPQDEMATKCQHGNFTCAICGY